MGWHAILCIRMSRQFNSSSKLNSISLKTFVILLTQMLQNPSAKSKENSQYRWADINPPDNNPPDINHLDINPPDYTPPDNNPPDINPLCI